jgi:SAM-dependent methyltransferase
MSADRPQKRRSQQERFAQKDRNYALFKQQHPDITFGQYRAQQIYDHISSGKPHYSLGGNLSDTAEGPQEFWSAGAAKAKYYFRRMGLKPHHRVIDYGCGSLRIGAHFIRYLNPGCYFGLDVVPNFFEWGKELVGNEIIAAKSPHLRTLGADSLSEAAEFGADFIFSAAVCIHVHPDELRKYFENLRSLTWKEHAQLHLNAAVSDLPRRIAQDSWAWPLQVYERSLRGLSLTAAPRSATVTRGEQPIWAADLVFRRHSDSEGLRGRARFVLWRAILLADPRTYGLRGRLGAVAKRLGIVR